ncbi:MAG TPA: hypothetical protein VGN55_00085 [Xanthobacteraceae bacterium]|jgi:hypothetical protein
MIGFRAPDAAAMHRDNVMEARSAPTKVRHQALVGSCSEGQPIPAVHNKKRSTIMCDYSLHHVATRPAKIEDRLVTTKFHNTITRGFAAVSDPRVAVCLMPGTELAFDRDVECEAALAIFPTKKIGQRVARFRQVNIDQPTLHHDALEFPDGQIVLLTALCANQHATVLQMPAGQRVKADADAADREAAVVASEPRRWFVG